MLTWVFHHIRRFLVRRLDFIRPSATAYITDRGKLESEAPRPTIWLRCDHLVEAVQVRKAVAVVVESVGSIGWFDATQRAKVTSVTKALILTIYITIMYCADTDYLHATCNERHRSALPVSFCSIGMLGTRTLNAHQSFAILCSYQSAPAMHIEAMNM